MSDDLQVQNILLKEITAAQNEVALCYHSVRGLYFLAFIVVVTIVCYINRTFVEQIFLKRHIHNDVENMEFFQILIYS